jgi:hypothetical protein
MASDQFVDWAKHAHRLAALEAKYRLLPIGWGKDGKGPMLSDWPKHPGFKVSELLDTPGIKAIGVITNPLLCFDFDGASSWEYAKQWGLKTSRSWTVARDTDPDRFKVLFAPTQQQLDQLPSGKIANSHKTKPVVFDGDGKVVKKAEALEIFCHPGRQVIVLGEHPKSGGYYYWDEDSGPESLTPPPSDWWEYVLQLSAEEAKAKTPSSKQSSTTWLRVADCPVCRRGPSDNPVCQLSDDSKILRCFVGSTFHPPLGLAPGQFAPGTDWAFVREQPVGWGRHHIFVKDRNPVRMARRWFRGR